MFFSIEVAHSAVARNIYQPNSLITKQNTFSFKSLHNIKCIVSMDNKNNDVYV